MIYKVHLSNQHIHHPCSMYCLLIWYCHHIYHHVGHNSSRCHVYSSTFLGYMQTDDSRDKLKVLRDVNDFDYYSRNIIKSIIYNHKKVLWSLRILELLPAMDALSVALLDTLFDVSLGFVTVSSQRFESSPYGFIRYIKYSRVIIISGDT